MITLCFFFSWFIRLKAFIVLIVLSNLLKKNATFLLNKVHGIRRSLFYRNFFLKNHQVIENEKLKRQNVQKNKLFNRVVITKWLFSNFLKLLKWKVIFLNFLLKRLNRFNEYESFIFLRRVNRFSFFFFFLEKKNFIVSIAARVRATCKFHLEGTPCS